jgi:hypothetical protein
MQKAVDGLQVCLFIYIYSNSSRIDTFLRFRASETTFLPRYNFAKATRAVSPHRLRTTSTHYAATLSHKGGLVCQRAVEAHEPAFRLSRHPGRPHAYVKV